MKNESQINLDEFVNTLDHMFQRIEMQKHYVESQTHANKAAGIATLEKQSRELDVFISGMMFADSSFSSKVLQAAKKKAADRQSRRNAA